MKNIKKISGLVLALVMALCIGISSFAAVNPSDQEVKAGDTVTVTFTYKGITGIYGTFATGGDFNVEIKEVKITSTDDKMTGFYNAMALAAYTDLPVEECEVAVTVKVPDDAKAGQKGTIKLSYETTKTADEVLPLEPKYETDTATLRIVADTTTTKTPDETTKTPDESTKAPDETTKAPDETTKTPDETTKAPDETTKAPDETTKAPDETTKAPDETTKTPDETTKAPDETTKAPDESTKAPDETTKAPDETTKAPDESTKAPDETTKAPDETKAPEVGGDDDPGNSGNQPPKTGDTMLCLGVVLAAAAVATGLLIRKKRISAE